MARTASSMLVQYTIRTPVLQRYDAPRLLSLERNLALGTLALLKRKSKGSKANQNKNNLLSQSQLCACLQIIACHTHPTMPKEQPSAGTRLRYRDAKKNGTLDKSKLKPNVSLKNKMRSLNRLLSKPDLPEKVRLNKPSPPTHTHTSTSLPPHATTSCTRPSMAKYCALYCSAHGHHMGDLYSWCV